MLEEVVSAQSALLLSLSLSDSRPHDVSNGVLPRCPNLFSKKQEARARTRLLIKTWGKWERGEGALTARFICYASESAAIISSGDDMSCLPTPVWSHTRVFVCNVTVLNTTHTTLNSTSMRVLQAREKTGMQREKEKMVNSLQVLESQSNKHSAACHLDLQVICVCVKPQNC